MTATARKNQPAESIANREIKSTRLIKAPRDLVWQMWTDPKHIAQWWGPKGFTNTIHQMDVRPGGVWDFIMHGPDGTDYKNKNVFAEVVKPERIVYDHVSAPKHHVTVTMEAEGNHTRLTMQLLFDTAEERDACAKKYGAVEGLDQTLGRLEEKLAQTAAGGSTTEPFVISRTFNAPRDLVYKAWTERERFMQWFGPKGFAITTASMDFRPGGTLLFCMRAPDGKEMWGKFVYREITPPERIVWINSFSDKDGGLTRHPMTPSWPAEMLSSATFTEQAGKTTVTIQWTPLNASAEELQIFENMRSGMNQGWTGTFEQLENYLANAKA
jgi:uncharacterized protein YndB with AHSA1/START domain